MGCSRLGLLFLFLALVDSSSLPLHAASSVVRVDLDSLRSRGRPTCNGQVGNCIDSAEEMMMDSEASRRFLNQNGGYVSYDALKADQVPCDKRGQSYYNCNQNGAANPYQRGCSYITKCNRLT